MYVEKSAKFTIPTSTIQQPTSIPYPQHHQTNSDFVKLSPLSIVLYTASMLIIVFLCCCVIKEIKKFKSIKDVDQHSRRDGQIYDDEASLEVFDPLPKYQRTPPLEENILTEPAPAYYPPSI
ncbi:hypothetical protein HDU92_008823 [Lobulomyces angularis]|nr:hypothetical protein HDU92_008823 [Lobulomyces angularis]